jgi:hypothetical protein
VRCCSRNERNILFSPPAQEEIVICSEASDFFSTNRVAAIDCRSILFLCLVLVGAPRRAFSLTTKAVSRKIRLRQKPAYPRRATRSERMPSANYPVRFHSSREDSNRLPGTRRLRNCACKQRAWPSKVRTLNPAACVNLESAPRTDGSSSTTATVAASHCSGRGWLLNGCAGIFRPPLRPASHHTRKVLSFSQ